MLQTMLRPNRSSEDVSRPHSKWRPVQSMQLKGDAASSAAPESMQAGSLRENHRRPRPYLVQGRFASSDCQQPYHLFKVERCRYVKPLCLTTRGCALWVRRSPTQPCGSADPRGAPGGVSCCQATGQQPVVHSGGAGKAACLECAGLTAC